jgi:hypothetical protein
VSAIHQVFASVANDGRSAASFLLTAEGVLFMSTKILGWEDHIHHYVDDGNGHVSFDLDFDANFFGMSQSGAIQCSGPIYLDSTPDHVPPLKQERPGNGGDLDLTVNGNTLNWSESAGPTKGVHYHVEFSYQV